MSDTVLGVFLNTVQQRGDAPAVRYKSADAKWQGVSWKQFDEARRKIAAGLLDLGVETNTRVVILSNTSYKWMVTDLAIQTCAGTTVSIYQSNLPHECEYIINDSGSTFAFVEDREQLDKLLAEKDKLEGLKKVVVMNDDADDSDWTMTWSELEKIGAEKLESLQGEFEKRLADLGPESELCLIYTSGTTGKPKGVVLTQANLAYEAKAAGDIGLIRAEDVQLMFLPMAHSFARVLQCIWLGLGHEMAIDSDITMITANMGEVKPTVMASVPRIFEKVYAKVTAGGLEAGGIKGKLFKWAIDLNEQYTQLMVEGKPIPGGLQFQLNLAKKLVFSKVGERLDGIFGGRIRYFVSGGAPLSRKIAYFFHHAGVKILEGYGLTETSAATCVNRPENIKIGTVGPPVPGTEIKIADDGEIMIKGPGVMREYWNRPEATSEVIGADGWFATGDIGVIDSDGYLKITDRKKDIIVTAGGKNVAPQNIENMIKSSSPLISQVMVYGDKRKYLVALVTLDPENLVAWGNENGLSGEFKDLSQNPKARDAVQALIDHSNKQLASYETIKKFEILDRDFEVGEELTPTLKVKRKFASQKYMNVLEGMYDEKVVD